MDVKINLIDEINKNRTVNDERLEQQEIKNQKFELNTYRIMILPCIIISSSMAVYYLYVMAYNRYLKTTED